MSEFIESFYSIKNPKKLKKSTKLYTKLYKHKWSFHILPSISFYFDFYPNNTKHQITGVYITFKFFLWMYTIGVYKSN